MGRWGLVVLLFISVVFTLNAATEPAETSTDNQPQIILLEGKLNKIRFETSRAEFFSPSGSITLKYDYIARIIKKKNKSGAKTRAEKTNDKTEKVQTVKLNGVLTQAEISQNTIEFYSADGSIKVGFGFLLKSIIKKSLTPEKIAKDFSKSKDLYYFTAATGNCRLKSYNKKIYKTFMAGEITKKLILGGSVYVQDSQQNIYKLNKASKNLHEKQFVKRSEYIQYLKNKIKINNKVIKELKQKIAEREDEIKNIKPRFKHEVINNRTVVKEYYRSSDLRRKKRFTREIKNNHKRIEKLKQNTLDTKSLIKKIKDTAVW